MQPGQSSGIPRRDRCAGTYPESNDAKRTPRRTGHCVTADMHDTRTPMSEKMKSMLGFVRWRTVAAGDYTYASVVSAINT